VDFFGWLNNLRKRIRPFRKAVGQDGDPRVLFLIRGPASMRHFSAKDCRTPVDCQAIFLSPPADIMGRQCFRAGQFFLQAAKGAAS
jgi:hypothetical protein